MQWLRFLFIIFLFCLRTKFTTDLKEVACNANNLPSTAAHCIKIQIKSFNVLDLRILLRSTFPNTPHSFLIRYNFVKSKSEDENNQDISYDIYNI